MSPRKQDSIRAGMVALLGAPWDASSSYLRGAAAAPGSIREALHCPSSNLCSESGADLAAEPRWLDIGDVELGDGAAAFQQIEEAVYEILNREAGVLVLGGDHSITVPVVRTHARKFPGLSILQVDAHPDLYDHFEGNRLSHACPFARIMEEGLVSRLVQVGIRTMNPHQRDQADRFGVEVVGVSDFLAGGLPVLEPPVYLSIDLDALDPAFAPGVSHPEPGGLSTRDVLGIIHGLPLPLVGADVVELNPTRDPAGITAMVAAKLTKEITATMLAEPSRR